ncbi:MAG: hypothetical protein JWP97_110 [Labilithrix sp.]|nr:hypothetical protein [Labilithrix sp.]
MRTSALLVVAGLCGACGACSGGDDEPPQAPAPAPGLPAASGSAPAPTAPPSSAPTSTTPPGSGVPARLACLARHFVGTPVADGAGWALLLPDGTRLPWDDGKTKTFDVTMEGPDLEDTLAIPYVAGAIAPVTAVDHDPGRIRNDVLFEATYGGTAAAVQAKLVTVPFAGQTVKFHALAAAALGRVSTRLDTLIAATPSLAGYVKGPLGGTFEWRPIANTTRMSVHSYGAAIDIVVAKSAYWEWDKAASDAGTFTWKNQIPQAIVDAFEAEGFAWGGRWYHYDTMHFEYRPELFDPACK